MKKYLCILVLALMMSSNAVLAHPTLESSTPKDNAMLMESPKKIILNFSKEVRLIKLTLKNIKGENIPFSFKKPQSAKKMFIFSLPLLSVDTYQVNWVTLGGDGHKMKGDFGFMVHEASDKNAMTHMHDNNTDAEKKSHSGKRKH